eukprot:CAMPEP_0172323028 /NCGR_PEP_ID=MMETSP1058-20130122/47653_1 /TAXON_ID=83371 /ORGANISM="Detonula confervacea, Strain CCMP 353" /LENGTH=97 /DNA_ID=CAMNT_0013038931 /DNA_START=8 /DNA_END=298 /DNA_ORIENTATION=+
MSLRIAIKRSLEEPKTAITQPAIVDTKMKKERPSIPHRRQRQRQPRQVELPSIDKCIRNSDPSDIDNFGFVEISGVLSECLIEQIQHEAQEKVTRHE